MAVSLNRWSVIGSNLKNSLQSVAQPFGAGEIFPLEGMRIWRVPPRHPFDRRLQVEEAMFLNQCGKLRAEAAGPRRLMDDDAAPRFLNRAGDRKSTRLNSSH